ncbi:type ISP restriction/modification enzyme [Paraburkholderia sp. MPAMCS5]|uniref:type ISP restriction/modification enzyme n=1 Tax=Paraburkholderia sp. MPAMCS5 TaxID=3112563 RepID=UPI002E186790|nr:type ISP restriction/modification enzyme [Paraburkholderia sp. MPAMCS5]
MYHGTVGGKYQPFEGICLADTFQLYEKEDLVDALQASNSARRKRQKKLDIRVIFGNPPYSVGQASANDNNQNVPYPHLDNRIAETYAAQSAMTSVKNLYDSYIRAIRWASDRIGDSGVIGFVTNAGFLEAGSSDGLRKCLADEFSNIYVFHLRGNARTSGEQRRREKDNVFGIGSRAPVAISVLVKNPNEKSRGQIYFHDIGDYLSRDEKLDKISAFGSIAGIAAIDGWQPITPDTHGDWLNQRDVSFNDFVVLGDKKGGADKLFANFSLGIGTNRDAWCYNSSKATVAANMDRTIRFYNGQVRGFGSAHGGLSRKEREAKVAGFISTDSTEISWSSSLIPALIAGKEGQFDDARIVQSLYRPFNTQWLYYDDMFNHRVGQMRRIFPHANSENLVIGFSAPSDRSAISTLVTDRVPSLHATDMVGSQYFPLYLYDVTDHAADSATVDLFSQSVDKETPRRDAITDAGLAHFQSAYPGEQISKEDIFYYIYGLLHSPDYRERYADNLSKELPRIPCVQTAADFWAFSKAGRKLADLHVNYETVEKYPLQIEGGGLLLTDADHRVEKMKYGKNGKGKDLTTLIYNDKITVKGIPLEAYEYVVNGKPALDWVVERQCVKVDKDSGIVNDANDYAIETMHNPRYPLELFQRVVTVSLETMKIVKSLPSLDIQQPGPTVGLLVGASGTSDAMTV